MLKERGQTVRIAERQRAEQERIDDRENRGVRAKAKGQNKNDSEGEAWLPAELPQRAAKILDERLHSCMRARRRPFDAALTR